MKNFKKILLLALSAIILSASLLSCSDKAEAPKGMKLASDPKADYQMFVPDKWIADMSMGAVSAYVSLDDPSSVSVMSFIIDGNISTVDEWWDSYTKEFSLVFDNFALESAENGTVGGNPAKKYTFTASLGETDYKMMQAASVKNDLIYLVTYTSIPDTFDSHLEEVEKILENFRFN